MFILKIGFILNGSNESSIFSACTDSKYSNIFIYPISLPFSLISSYLIHKLKIY